MLNLRGIGPKRIRKLVAEGSLQRIQRGAYIYTRDAQALTPEERLTVRCIAAQMMGLQGIFSHTSAAALWGLDVLSVPQMISVYSCSHSTSDKGRITRHYSATGPEEVTRLPGTSIMVTTVARTLQDCARSMPFREAVVLADSIMRRGLMEPHEVTEILLSLTGYGGSAGPFLAQAVDAALAGQIHNAAAVAGLLATERIRAKGWQGLRSADAPWLRAPYGFEVEPEV